MASRRFLVGCCVAAVGAVFAAADADAACAAASGEKQREIFDVAVVGLGPNGLRSLRCAAERNLSAVAFERGRVGETFRLWPAGTDVVGEFWELAIHSQAPAKGVSFGDLRSLCGERLDLTGRVQSCERDSYVQYLEENAAQHRQDVHEHTEVVAITRAEAGAGADSEEPLWAIRSRASEGEAEPREAEYLARFVILAIGLSSNPRPLGVPGDSLPHVVTTSAIQKMDYSDTDALVVGFGDTSLHVSLLLCERRVRRLVLCSRSVDELLPEPAEEQSIDEWTRIRYRVDERMLTNEVNYYKHMYAMFVRKLHEYGARGVFEFRGDCRVSSVNGTHALVGSADDPLKAPEALAASLVVAAAGGEPDEELLESMAFPTPNLDVFTGETDVQGIFTVGFDLPGGTSHSGPGIYDNWLSWGGAAAAETCRAIAAQVPTAVAGVLRSHRCPSDALTRGGLCRR